MHGLFECVADGLGVEKTKYVEEETYEVSCIGG